MGGREGGYAMESVAEIMHTISMKIIQTIGNVQEKLTKFQINFINLRLKASPDPNRIRRLIRVRVKSVYLTRYITL